MTEYSRIAKGNFVAQGSTAVINLPFKPDFVELWNYTNIAAGAQASKALRAWWDASLIVGGNNPTMMEVYTAGSVVAFDVITNTAANPAINAFSAGQLLQYGPTQGHNLGSITDFSIAKSVSPTTVTTVGTDHGLQSGDVIVFEGLFQTAITGMPQINGIPFTVTRLTANTFTIDWDTSGTNYTAFNTGTSTGNRGIYKKVLYPYLYFPGQSFITSIGLGATTTISTTDAHNFVVNQEVAIRIPSQWGTVELNSLPNNTIPGSPIYGYVVAVTDYNTVVVNINSSAFTAFNVNQPVASVVGLSYPQIVAVGDVSTGGVAISAGSALYPPPQFMPIGTTTYNTINGPAIRGAFVNNTSQGFTIGAGVGTNNAGVSLMATSDVIEWRAFLHDMSIP